MSMHESAVNRTGLVLNWIKVDGKPIGSAVLEEMGDNDACSCQSLTGETFPYDRHGNVKWSDGEYWSDETVYYIDLPKYPSLFKRAYEDMNELLKDMKRAYDRARKRDDRLPKLTLKQVLEHFREIQGTYCG